MVRANQWYYDVARPTGIHRHVLIRKHEADVMYDYKYPYITSHVYFLIETLQGLREYMHP